MIEINLREIKTRHDIVAYDVWKRASSESENFCRFFSAYFRYARLEGQKVTFS